MKSSNFKRIVAVVLCLAAILRILAIDLRPDNISVQSGGGMGAVTCGTGWRYGKCGRWETELLIGYIPRYDSNSSKATVALKENFVPWQVRLNDSFTLEPLTTSLYFTTIISKRFWTQQPDRYPSGYYILPTKIRANISIGQRVRWHVPKARLIDCFSAYYEFGTCDIYALCAAGNKEIKPHDWLQLCIGIKMTFKK